MYVDYDFAFKFIIEKEGGYSNDPRDPGGETKFGISKRSFPLEDIKNLTLERAKKLYKDFYWNICQCDAMPVPLNLIVFDCAVNQGTFTAIKILQNILGVEVDGIIGNETLRKIKEKNLNELVELYLTDRALRYCMNKHFYIYGRGWLRRLFSIINRLI